MKYYPVEYSTADESNRHLIHFLTCMWNGSLGIGRFLLHDSSLNKNFLLINLFIFTFCLSMKEHLHHIQFEIVYNTCLSQF